MYTNAEYEAASAAIKEFKAGKHATLEKACSANKALKHVAEAMIETKVVVKPKLKTSRKGICDSCPENKNDMCMQCACPMSHVLYSNQATCPLGKW